MVVTIVRNSLFKILCYKTVSQLISINHLQSSKKCLNNSAVNFSFDDFSFMNQLVKEYQNAPDNIFQGHPDNNYEAGRPHNLTVRLF